VRLFSDVASRVDDPYFAHAMALAARGRGQAWPNPVVGCVIARDGSIVGEGFHPRAGQPHAEVYALRDAGDMARGATAWVTLEPCAHHGKTPPCVDALVAAGVAHVFIGMRDPNSDAAGGAEALTSAGVQVEFASDPMPFAEMNAGWLKRLATGMPLTTAKCGLSLDARPAFAVGDRAAITGPSGGIVTRRLRMGADAVMVSAATVNADDPALTVRDPDGSRAEDQPTRVVLISETLPASTARVFTDGEAPTVALASSAVDAEWLGALPADVAVLRWDAAGGLTAALRALGSHGLGELLIEPGPRLFSALWDAGLIDELVTVSAGGVVGPGVDLYRGEPDRQGDSLIRRLKPLEAGIVGDVSVTVWGRIDGPGEE
jgi:diaminohydroxyphosphoribosylaminopyrimidine deaminase / 5-amino-6-(5-phosphoribosylamino)uracil reductase